MPIPTGDRRARGGKILLGAVIVILLLVLAVQGASGPAGVARPSGDPSSSTKGSHQSGSHGLSMYGELKYEAAFDHFEYVNPCAPKGGEVRLAAIGTFDTLNPFVLKGVAAAGIAQIFDTLTVSSADEPFAQYGLVAETITVAPDRSSVTFTLRPEARFHDGRSITADDVIWTFETLKTKGQPFFRTYYAQVRMAERLDERAVRFTFASGENRELALIVGQLPVLSKAYWSGRRFEETTLEPPLGSGPYRVANVEAGRSISYRRVQDYWGAALPVNVGRYNFDSIGYDYYRDTTVALEAFKGGEYDFRRENVAKHWNTAYDTPAVRQGLIRKEEIKHALPTGMQAFVYNTRQPVFQDPRVRRALGYAFDFEWTNRTLFYGAYTRTKSYFSNSEMAALGLPSEAERQILATFRDRLPREVFTSEYRPPESTSIRPGLLHALRLLKDAGWVVERQKLVNARTGAPLTFEILLSDPTWERITLPFAKNLERLGVDARVRTVDTAQYQNRVDSFDFDMTVWVWPQSVSPGNEQRNYWASAAASTWGSGNLAGIRNAVVDELIELMIQAPDRNSLVVRARSLDRVLLWGHYVIPHWHTDVFRVAYWNKLRRPVISPKYALGFETWWVDPRTTASRPAGRSSPARSLSAGHVSNTAVRRMSTPASVHCEPTTARARHVSSDTDRGPGSRTFRGSEANGG
jgi:microcin C transport system substrate-binding protein